MSDKELDDLFKEASGSQHTPYDVSDWQKMESLLDGKTAVRSPFWNWKKYTGITLLFLSSVVAVELWSVNKNDASISEEPALIVQESALSSLRGKDSVKTETLDNAKQVETNEVRENNPVAGKQKLRAQKNKGEANVTNHSEKSPIKKKSPDNERSLIKSTVTDSRVKESTNDIISKATTINDSITQTQESETKKTDSQNNAVPFLNKETKQDSLDNPVLDEAKAADSLKEQLPEQEKKQVENTRLFSLKLALSPDFSSVGYFTPGKTGFNYGLIAEYAFSKHVSVSLGGIWSKKLYTYKSIESSYGTTVLNGRTIDGDCRILDVPVNVNYYFNPGHRFTFYGSLGLSSYIMFSEDYKYDVIKNGNSYDYATHVDRKNNEWFKMTNISLGLQYRLRSHWALQIEPFVKAPLSGIGEGDYKLVSSGAFFNVKYTFK